MDEMAQQKSKERLKKIAGQVAGIERMVDDDRYCVEILNQIAAVRSALDNLGVLILSSHIETCLIATGDAARHARAQGKTKAELLAELESTLSRFLR